ncbi:MAG: hypothetical protein E6Y18_15750 [Serratia marcescens]|uniref:hypothetical protein n=1 Tax=Serratia marcescens TaxID=615 RepID=UPI0018D75669|nr:hypothetical protein [Serratia marcescens]MDU4690461.1 hypothetical protein [Serratia marcescens]HAT3852327.1 hypothetical protein [Serratia marcescens]HBH6865681.1 hypothetical protein [Serratia marcescens]HEJ6924788.1 hypothetical protein [Serratia marcescens]
MTEEERLVNLYKLVTNYNLSEHQKSLPSSEDNSLQWFKSFKFLHPASWAASPQKIPYIAATTLIDSYSCLPRRPDMAFSYLWTAINNSYNDLLLKQNTSGDRLTDTKGIDNSLALISSFLNSKVDNKAILPEEHESKTINEIMVEFVKRLPDKNLNFLGSYILKGMAISIKNSEDTLPSIRKIHISSSYQTFEKRFKTIHNHLYWNYGKKYSSICTISESTDKTSVDFGIKDEEKSRMITRAVRKELQRILVNNPELDQFDVAGNSTPKKAAFTNDIDKLEFLIFGLLYASRNNNIHGNVASRLNSIFANSKTITAATWNFLFEYFYLSLLLLALKHIELDDLDIHLYNVKLLKVTNKDSPVVS